MKKYLKLLFKYFGYKVQSTKYELEALENEDHLLHLNFDHVLSNYLLNMIDINRFRFIQVGAFDGVECDPIRKYLLKYNWNGILVEPQKEPFKALQSLYRDQNNIQLINAAIGQATGDTFLYTLEDNQLPNWARGMASFNKDNILKHSNLVPNLSDFIKPIKIPVLTFDQLISKFNISKLDLLQIDTEGFDGEIIKLFPMRNLKPSIIHFEYKHLPKKELAFIMDYLISLQYKLAKENGEDMIAVLE